jgi:hypothetical protein
LIDLLLQMAGASICLLALADLYIVVLYARSDLGFLASRLSLIVWRLFRGVARRLPDGPRSWLLTFVGPTLMALLVVVWVGLLLVGFALIAWPALGDEIRKMSGPTPTDFTTALYYSGYSLATLGFGDIVPQTGLYRMLAVLEAALGFAVLTLALTYLMSVYSALVRRNSLALALYHRSARTGNAGELLARLGDGGDFSRVPDRIDDLNLLLHDLYESHHSYLTLHYFHFREPFYGMANMVGLMADVATLAQTALDHERHRGVVESAAMAETLSSSTFLLERLSAIFLPGGFRPGAEKREEESETARWRQHFKRATERLAEAGASVAEDRQAAANRYIELRRRWDSHVRAFRTYMLERPIGPS